jgi:hypothetical protein
MTWVAVPLVALAGFTGAGSFSMWRTGHRATSVVMLVLALIFVGLAILAMIPGPDQS